MKPIGNNPVNAGANVDRMSVIQYLKASVKAEGMSKPKAVLNAIKYAISSKAEKAEKSRGLQAQAPVAQDAKVSDTKSKTLEKNKELFNQIKTGIEGYLQRTEIGGRRDDLGDNINNFLKVDIEELNDHSDVLREYLTELADATNCRTLHFTTVDDLCKRVNTILEEYRS